MFVLKIGLFLLLSLVDGALTDPSHYCLDNKTWPIPMIPPPCISISKKDCLDLEVALTLDDKIPIYGPQKIPLRLILESNEGDLCKTTNFIPGIVVLFCGNLTRTEYNRKDKKLTLCFSLYTNLTNVPPFSIPCFDIDDCDFPESCPNNCNNLGTCHLGVCKCNPGKFGLDCSAELKENCINMGTKSTCWNITQPACDQIDIEISQTNRQTIHERRLGTPISVNFSCPRNTSDLSDCVDCASLEDVLIVGNTLKGSPAVTITCGGAPISVQKYPFQTLINFKACTPPSPTPPSTPVQPSPNPKPPTPDPEPEPDSGQDWKDNKGVYVIAAVVLLVVLLALIGVGFYLYKRCVKQNRSGAYATISSVDPFDGTPMQDDADAINYSFSSSDND